MSFWTATQGIVFLYCSYVCKCAKNPNFANCRFSFRQLQILISQTTDFHFVSFHFVSQTTVSLCNIRLVPLLTINELFTTYTYFSQELRFFLDDGIKQKAATKSSTKIKILFSIRRFIEKVRVPFVVKKGIVTVEVDQIDFSPWESFF